MRRLRRNIVKRNDPVLAQQDQHRRNRTQHQENALEAPGIGLHQMKIPLANGLSDGDGRRIGAGHTHHHKQLKHHCCNGVGSNGLGADVPQNRGLRSGPAGR